MQTVREADELNSMQQSTGSCGNDAVRRSLVVAPLPPPPDEFRNFFPSRHAAQQSQRGASRRYPSQQTSANSQARYVVPPVGVYPQHHQFWGRAPAPPQSLIQSDPLTLLGYQVLAQQLEGPGHAAPPPPSAAGIANTDSSESVREQQARSEDPQATAVDEKLSKTGTMSPSSRVASAGQYAPLEMERQLTSSRDAAEVLRYLNHYRRHLSVVSGSSAVPQEDSPNEIISGTTTLSHVSAVAALQLSQLLVRGRGGSQQSSGYLRQQTYDAEGSDELGSAVTQLSNDLLQIVKLNPTSVATSDLVSLLRVLARSRTRDMAKYRTVMRALQARPGQLSAVEWCDALASVTRGIETQMAPPAATAASRLPEMKRRGQISARNFSLSRVAASASPKAGMTSRDTSKSFADWYGGQTALGQSVGISITTHETSFINFATKSLVARRKEFVSLSPKVIASLVRSCSHLGHKDLELLKHLGVAALKKQQQFSPEDWSACLRGFIQFGVPLRDDCVPKKRPREVRDWERPPPPKRPTPMSQC